MAFSGSAQETNTKQWQHNMYCNHTYTLVYVPHSLFALFK